MAFARFDPSSDAGVEYILPNLDANFRARFVVARNNLLVFSGNSAATAPLSPVAAAPAWSRLA